MAEPWDQPCRCGATHTGDYAMYDWGHHNCYHTEFPLVWLDREDNYLMCMSCGQTFYAESDEEVAERKGRMSIVNASTGVTLAPKNFRFTEIANPTDG